VRHPVFLNLGNYDLKDVLLAIVAGYAELSARRGNLTWGGNYFVTIANLKKWLFDEKPREIHDALSELIRSQLLLPMTDDYGGHEVIEGVRVTPSGSRAYRKEVKARLGIVEDETILDERRLDEIRIFVVWQSDDGRSRGEIDAALPEVVRQLSEHAPVAPLTPVRTIPPGHVHTGVGALP